MLNILILRYLEMTKVVLFFALYLSQIMHSATSGYETASQLVTLIPGTLCYYVLFEVPPCSYTNAYLF